MGNEKPEFSTFAYITMMALAGVGSGTVYWAFLEWSYYIKTPPFNIAADSIEATEWAVTYSLHHRELQLGLFTPSRRSPSCNCILYPQKHH